jgi:hypothetical protein
MAVVAGVLAAGLAGYPAPAGAASAAHPVARTRPQLVGNVVPTFGTTAAGGYVNTLQGVDATTVYAAGHVRWAQNGNGCNAPGAGSIPDPGLWGVNAATGNVITNSRGTAGLYSMSKANAQDMLITSAGLWVASTNRYGSDVCGGVSGHAGICLLPYPSS